MPDRPSWLSADARAGPAGASFRMYTRAGADQIARDLSRSTAGTASSAPLPDVFAACVRASEGLVIDVGANTGFYSLVAVSASGTAEVHAFEPYPAALVCLAREPGLNRSLAERVTVFPQAVSDEAGAGVLHVPDPGPRSGRDQLLAQRRRSRRGSWTRWRCRWCPSTPTSRRWAAQRWRWSRSTSRAWSTGCWPARRGRLSEPRPVVFLEVLPVRRPGGDRADPPAPRLHGCPAPAGRRRSAAARSRRRGVEPGPGPRREGRRPGRHALRRCRCPGTAPGPGEGAVSDRLDRLRALLGRVRFVGDGDADLRPARRVHPLGPGRLGRPWPDHRPQDDGRRHRGRGPGLYSEMASVPPATS